MPLSNDEAQEALQRALCITETLTPAGLMDRAARLIEAMRANCNGRASVIDGCHLTIASLQQQLEEAQTRLSAVARQRDVRDSILTAINHDPEALAIYRANHPDTQILCEDVFDVRPKVVTGGRVVGLAWFSPDCTYFSKARGSRPHRDKRGVEEGVAVAQRVAQPTPTLRQRLESLAGGPNLRVVVTPLAEMHLDEPAEPPRLCSGHAGDLFAHCGGEILLQFWVGGRVTIVLVRDDEAGQLWDASLTKRGARPHAVLRLTVTG